MSKQRPTRRQLEVLRAYIRAGSVAAAAYELGIGETTVRQHLSGWRSCASYSQRFLLVRPFWHSRWHQRLLPFAPDSPVRGPRPRDWQQLG
jgi:hypothetical protein